MAGFRPTAHAQFNGLVCAVPWTTPAKGGRGGDSLRGDSPSVAVLASAKGRRQPGIVSHHFRIVRCVQHVEACPGHTDRSLTPHDVLRRVDLNHLMIELVADEGVAVLQPNGARRQWHGDAAGASVGDIHQHFEPDLRNSAVRDYRGAAGNVAMVEL